MDQKTECCGRCKWSERDKKFKEDYICVNDESEHCADWVEYEDYCDNFEEREPAKRRKK
ncbi:MAG: hypothetical protein IKX20_03005 [Paludibacteraceae bacterium]|nr:hypothetical protein [Paludibacteraceae bacterium]